MKNKKNIVIVVAAVAVVAVVAILLCNKLNWPIDHDKTSGDIGKAVRFSRENAEPIANLQELIQNDSAYREGLTVSYVVMQNRTQQFDALIELSNHAAADIKEFDEVLSEMNGTSEMLRNVSASLNTAGLDLDAVLGGEDRPNVEQNTINAALAYTTLQKQNRLADKFIEVADSYLKKNDGSEQLKLARDSWVDYQQMTASLDGNSRAAQALDKKGYLLSPERTAAAMEASGPGLRLRFLVSASLANQLGLKNNLAAGYTSDILANALAEARVVNLVILGKASLDNTRPEILSSDAEHLNDLGFFFDNAEQLNDLGFFFDNAEQLNDLGHYFRNADNMNLLILCSSENVMNVYNGALGHISDEMSVQAVQGVQNTAAMNLLCSTNELIMATSQGLRPLRP